MITLFKYIFIYVFFLFMFLSCGSSSENKKGDKEKKLLKKSMGAKGEIVVIIDSTQWNGKLGKTLRNVFYKDYPALPQSEPYFDLVNVDPTGISDYMRRHRNLLIVATMENKSKAGALLRSYFTKSSLKQIKQDSSRFIHPSEDQFAANQCVLYLFSNRQKTLINKIKAHKKEILTYFNQKEIKRRKKVFNYSKKTKSISKKLKKNHGINLMIPPGFKLAIDTTNFVWLRKPDRIDQNIFVSYRKYQSEKQFKKENILSWRDSIGNNLIFGRTGERFKGDTSFMTLQDDYFPVQFEKDNFNNNFSIEARGLWKLSNNTMGGPFLSYTFAGKDKERIYYLEAFLYSPGKDKRKYMRDLEAILRTFDE